MDKRVSKRVCISFYLFIDFCVIAAMQCVRINTWAGCVHSHFCYVGKLNIKI